MWATKTWRRSTLCSPFRIWRGVRCHFAFSVIIQRTNSLDCLLIRVKPCFLCSRVLCRVFGIELPGHKGAILLELYLQTVLFCRAQMFKSEQSSALLSIVKSVHEVNIGKQSVQTFAVWYKIRPFFFLNRNKTIKIILIAGTPLNNIEQCFQYCKELLLYHSVRVCTTSPGFCLIVWLHFDKCHLIFDLCSTETSV